jgi:hypothetical protein
MSIIRAAVKLIIKEHGIRKFSGRALSLGVPEAHATRDEIDAWFRVAGMPPSEAARDRAEVTTNAIGRRLGFLSGRSFLNFFGFAATDCLDVPGCEHPPEILHDLNDRIALDLHCNYDFVMDPGTLEHVFDQRICLENIADALKLGGTVCHLVPVYSYNGGYYSINPNVLHDFYGANGFDSLKAYIIMWDRYRAYSRARTRCYHYDDAIMGSRHAIGDADQVRYTPHLLFFARKASHVTHYTAPLQFEGNYTGEASSLAGTRALTLESRGKGIAKMVFAVLPFQFAFYLQSSVYRWLSFMRARRVASFKI